MDAGIEIGKFDSELSLIIEELNRDFVRLHWRNKTSRTDVETIDPIEPGTVGPMVMKLATLKTVTKLSGYLTKKILAGYIR